MGEWWERGIGEMRPGEAVTAQRCLRWASADDKSREKAALLWIACISSEVSSEGQN